MENAERLKPRGIYVEEAIQAALEARWEDALALNRALLERHGADEDTHNRIGKAMTELGRHKEAVEAYSETLKMNPLNLIAQKNLRKLQLAIESKALIEGGKGAIDVDLFAEEPGKSALTILTPPKSGSNIAVVPGDVVDLHPVDGGLRAQTTRGVVLGDVDAKIAHRLVPLIQTGNKYSAAVARTEESQIEIVIREIFQSPENLRKSSFPVSREKREEFRPYAKDSLLAEREESEYEEESENDEDLAGEETEAEARPAGESDESELEETALVDDDADESDEDTRPEDEY